MISIERKVLCLYESNQLTKYVARQYKMSSYYQIRRFVVFSFFLDFGLCLHTS